jgi:hypothetical protein
MAKYGIFIDNNLTKVASSESERDTLISHGWIGTVKTLTDDQFNNYADQLKLASLSGDTIVEEDTLAEYPTTKDGQDVTNKSRESLKEEIDSQILAVSNFLEKNTSADWSTYKNKLEELDANTITLPINTPFQQWFKSQPGVPALSILQLP